jgi:glycosyltransferase involved in cell wall biosynthesis
MACGTPVIATEVGGIAEIVATPAAGVLIDEYRANGIWLSVARLREALPTRSATRAYAEQFGWQPTTEGQLALFRSVMREWRL